MLPKPVKKALSILFLTLLLLNVMGFYGVFMGWQYKNSRDFSSNFDMEDVSEGEKLLIRIPIAVPYMGSTEYEKVSGEIEYNGEFYNLIQQKLSNDTLYVVCVRNHEREHLETALEDYVKTFADHTSTRSGSKIVPSFIKDFIPSCITIETSVAGWATSFRFVPMQQNLLYVDQTVTSPPPRS